MMTQQLESLNELCSDLSDLNKINLTSIEKFPDCNEVCELSDELQTLEKSEAENSESIINLEASLEDIKYQNKKVRKSFDQINQLENAYIVKKEVLTRKKSAIEDVKRQIAESKITLNKLKVTVRAVERSDTPENVESKKEVFIHSNSVYYKSCFRRLFGVSWHLALNFPDQSHSSVTMFEMWRNHCVLRSGTKEPRRSRRSLQVRCLIVFIPI